MNIHAFVSEILTLAFEDSDCQSWDVLESAIKNGLLTETEYNPEVHGEDGLSYCETGAPWLIYSEKFKAIKSGAST